jgi:hypothetical protein
MGGARRGGHSHCRGCCHGRTRSRQQLGGELGACRERRGWVPGVA